MSVPVPIAILLTSLLVVGLASAVFRDRPASRRLLIIGLMVLTGLFPIICLIAGLRFEVGVQGLSLSQVSTENVERVSLLLMTSGLTLVVIQLGLIFRARRRLTGLPTVSDGFIDQTIRDLAEAAGVTVPVSVRMDACVCSSSLGRRLIVLSTSSSTWHPETLRAVLAHELVHLSRRDDVWLLLARLLSLQFWWLPWCRLLPELLENAIEESCDDLAAYLVQSEQEYLHGVFEAATGETAAAVGAVQAAGGSIVDRFRRFSTYRDQQVDSRGLYWSSLTVMAALAFIWTIQVVPAVEPLADSVRIVATAVDGEGETLSVRLGEPPTGLSEDVVRTGAPTSYHDPP